MRLFAKIYFFSCFENFIFEKIEKNDKVTNINMKSRTCTLESVYKVMTVF